MTTSTSLNSRVKISKAHPQIELRGKLDSLNAQIILLQASSQNKNYIDDLEEVHKIIRKLQRCEACDEVFEERIYLFGLDEDEIHSRSHSPEKFYGIGHILPSFEMKLEAAEINYLRAVMREAEICACKAYDSNDRFRIIHVLNRLSSALYILEYKYLPEGYSKVINFARLDRIN